MTHGELSEYANLKREIALDQARLADNPELADTITVNIQRCVEKQKRILEHIHAIPNSLTRQVFTLKFCEGLTIQRIAAVIGGGNTQDSIKKRIYRYIKQN